MFFKLSAEEPDVVLQSDPGKYDPNYIKSAFPALHFIGNFIIPGSKSHPPQQVDLLSFSSRKTSSCLPDHLFQLCLAHQIANRIIWFIICITNTVIYIYKTKKNPGSSLPPSEGSPCLPSPGAVGALARHLRFAPPPHPRNLRHWRWQVWWCGP